MDKKGEERQILNMIFSEELYKISSSEEPDFILTDEKYGVEFGVEITEFFRDDANARLLKIDNYIDSIIEPNHSKRKPNKGDTKKLEVREFTRISEDNILLESYKGVYVKCLTPREKADIICECIRTKESKLKNYKKNTNENYLIIYDQENCLYGEDNCKLYELISGNSLFDALSESKFREIYFITGASSRKTYSGLISLHFMNNFSQALAFGNNYHSISENKLDCALNILYNLGFRFQWSYDDETNMYYLIYHDCIIKFAKFQNPNFCICGRICGLPIGVPISEKVDMPLKKYVGNYNAFLKIYGLYKNYIFNNETQHYVYSQDIIK